MARTYGYGTTGCAPYICRAGSGVSETLPISKQGHRREHGGRLAGGDAAKSTRHCPDPTRDQSRLLGLRHFLLGHRLRRRVFAS
jgi:hypothetical protein